MLLVPIAGMVYFVAFLGFERSLQIFYTCVWSGIVTGVFVATAWLSIWRGAVRWTAWRRWGTVLVAPASIATAAALGWIGALSAGGPDESFIAFVGSTLGILLWLASTAILWRETRAERLDRIAQGAGRLILCPKCGYNLMGLYEAVCPECGTRFTLDQLYGAQRIETLEPTE